jgi:uncharacterized protein DUF3455
MKTAMQWIRYSLLAASVVLLAACAEESPLGVSQRSASRQMPPETALAATTVSPSDQPGPDLAACPDLRVDRSAFLYHVFADGVQIYRWTGSAWGFVGPSAVLSADAGGVTTVGNHYSGPTWESVSGSKVVAAVQKRCTPNANAIQWLLLGAVSNTGPGIFDQAALIQRVNTVGGMAPSAPGSFVGEEVRVPYTAEYYFYRAP